MGIHSKRTSKKIFAIKQMQCATMHLLNIGMLQYALFDIKQIWFINGLWLIILHCNPLTSSDCNIAGKMIELFEYIFLFVL